MKTKIIKALYLWTFDRLNSFTHDL